MIAGFRLSPYNIIQNILYKRCDNMYMYQMSTFNPKYITNLYRLCALHTYEERWGHYTIINTLSHYITLKMANFLPIFCTFSKFASNNKQIQKLTA